MRFHLIDALRGIAASWVVLFHVRDGHHIDGLVAALPDFVVKSLFTLGESGVPIFFVISGFVIAHSLSRDTVNFTYLTKFTLRRAIRLDPPYWASILLVLLFAWLSAEVKGEHNDATSIGTIIAHLFYAQGLLNLGQLSNIYWTLCLEIQFYLVFCLLIGVAQYFEKHLKNATLYLFLCAALVSSLWPLGILKENLHPGLFLPHWFAFLLGVFVYWVWKGKLPAAFLYVYLIGILLGTTQSDSLFGMAAAYAALFLYLSTQFGYISAMNWKWLQFLGLISYSLYLTHNTILGASFFVIYKFIGDSIGAQIFALCFSLFACISFAYIFWWAFEKWSIKLGRKIKLHNAK